MNATNLFRSFTLLARIALFGGMTSVMISGMVSSTALADQAQAPLKTISIKIKNATLETELATTSEQRYMGLSFRKSLANNAAMLFVYSREHKLVFTMRNTLLPLSIAFIADDLTINEIQHMDVGPGQLFPAKQPAQYALEVNQGWFATNNIKPGDKLILP